MTTKAAETVAPSSTPDPLYRVPPCADTQPSLSTSSPDLGDDDADAHGGHPWPSSGATHGRAEPQLTDTFTGPPLSTDVHQLAADLERMAQHATPLDHHKSPIVDAILRADSARPFVGAIRALVAQLTRERPPVPYDSVVVDLVRDCDLDVAIKLELLREFLRCDSWDNWHPRRREELVQLLEDRNDTLAAAIVDVLREGGRASLDTLVDWLGDENTQGNAKASVAEAANHLLHILANDDPGAALDALGSMRTTRAMLAMCDIARLHPDVAMVFARRSVTEGASYRALVTLMGLEGCEPLRAEVIEIATTIASNPMEGAVRGTALTLLLSLPTVAPNVWELLRALPDPNLHGLPRRLGWRLWDGLLEPLDVLEHWMRTTDAPEFLGDLCEAFGIGLRDPAKSPLSEEVQKRVVADLAEAWRRGANNDRAAAAAEMSLYGRSDAQYTALGLEELACALALTDARCRRSLLYPVTAGVSRGAEWPSRLLGQIADASDFAGKLRCVRELARESSRPDHWSEKEINRLLTACRPSMTEERATSDCLDAVPCGDGVQDGFRPILAWFAGEFPRNAAIRAALARVKREGGWGLKSEVQSILERGVVRTARSAPEVGLHSTAE